jgi:hypothetical protein
MSEFEFNNSLSAVDDRRDGHLAQAARRIVSDADFPVIAKSLIVDRPDRHASQALALGQLARRFHDFPGDFVRGHLDLRQLEILLLRPIHLRLGEIGDCHSATIDSGRWLPEGPIAISFPSRLLRLS